MVDDIIGKVLEIADFTKVIEDKPKTIANPVKIENKPQPNDNVVYKSDEEYFKIGLEEDPNLNDWYNGINLHYNSTSEEQLAIFNKIMYWTNNNANLALELYQNSPHYNMLDLKHKEKWQRDDYRNGLLVKANQSTTARDKDYEFQMEQNKRHLTSASILQNGKTDFNDIELSTIFADYIKDRCVHVSDQNCWLYYNGKVWQEGTKFVQNELKKFIRFLETNVKKLPKKHRKAYLQMVKKLTTYTKRKNIIEDTKSEFNFQREDFDKQTELINLKNGTYNLKTGELQEFNPNDKMTLIANCNYNPDADQTVWLQFINEIFQNNQDLIEYVQRVCGYLLYFRPIEECVFFLIGYKTRNGKSTFIEAIKTAFGTYACSANANSFAQKNFVNSSGASEDIARLKGVRLVVVSELPKNMVMDSALLKTMTGGDTITARKLYQSSFEFVPVFKLVYNTNHLPTINDDSVFRSNRIRIIPFERHFSKSEQNKELKSILKQQENLDAIFLWMLEGLKKYQTYGLNESDNLQELIDSYRDRFDKIKDFFESYFDKDDNAKETLSTVYPIYCSWCKKNSYQPLGKSKFKTELQERNLILDTATIDGKTERNVIIGYKYNSDYALCDLPF